MPNDVRDFFDSLAPNWDEHSEEKLPHIISLLDRVHIRSGSRVLDLACGTGIISGILHDRYGAEVLGLDVSVKMIEIARGKYASKDGVCFECDDFYETLFHQEFDYIVCHNAFPHFVDVERFVDHIADALVPGGEFVVFHSLGRAKLQSHHDGLGPTISRNLGPVEEEARAFSKRLTVLECDESDSHFWIRGRK